MSSKGWVSRKREQFEQFARTQDGSENRVQTQVAQVQVAQVQVQVPSEVEEYKPVKDGEIKVKMMSR